MSATVLYPRAVVALHAVVAGEDLQTRVVPARMTITRRSHAQADTCEVEIHGAALPFDPRAIEDLYVGAYFGCVPRMDARVEADERNLRFLGYADKIEPSRGEKAPVVKVAARDLSALLRDFKPVPPAAAPRYADTVGGAVARVVEAALGRVAGGAGSALLTVADTEDAAAPLGAAVGERARGAAVPVKPDASAWEVCEHAAGLAARLVTVELSQVVVRRPRAEGDGLANPAATLRFGTAEGNLLAVDLVKKFQRNRKGVRVVSFDPVSRRRIEGVYPPDGELPPRRRAQGSRGARAQAPERDVFPVPDGVTSADELARIAERIYRERSRQELEVSCETPVLTPEILALRSGDRIAVDLAPDVADLVRRDPSVAARRLVQRLGVSEDAARILVRVAESPRPDRFYVRSVTLTWDAAGKSHAKIDAVNLIHVEPSR